MQKILQSFLFFILKNCDSSSMSSELEEGDLHYSILESKSYIRVQEMNLAKKEIQEINKTIQEIKNKKNDLEKEEKKVAEVLNKLKENVFEIQAKYDALISEIKKNDDLKKELISKRTEKIAFINKKNGNNNKLQVRMLSQSINELKKKENKY